MRLCLRECDLRPLLRLGVVGGPLSSIVASVSVLLVFFLLLFLVFFLVVLVVPLVVVSSSCSSCTTRGITMTTMGVQGVVGGLGGVLGGGVRWCNLRDCGKEEKENMHQPISLPLSVHPFHPQPTTCSHRLPKTTLVCPHDHNAVPIATVVCYSNHSVPSNHNGQCIMYTVEPQWPMLSAPLYDQCSTTTAIVLTTVTTGRPLQTTQSTTQ